MSDSIRPYQNYTGGLVPQAVLNGTINTIVYASNYNDLDNKPSINSVELRGNKTASDLGLATPEDITVTSVNTQTGDVSLTGQNIPYDSALSVTEKINDLESQIVDSGVSSVNGYTGVVNLTGNEIPYTIGKSVNTKINEVESAIPIVDYPVTSVNGKTGAVVLAGSDIEYSEGVSLTDQIDNVSGEISDLTGADIPMTALDSTKVATAIGDLTSLTTTNQDSLVEAVNEVNGNLYYHKGDTINIDYETFVGFIGNSTKTLYFYIPLSKPLASDVTGITFGGTFNSRNATGTLLLNAVDIETAQTKVYHPSINGIQCELTFANSLGGSDNYSAWLMARTNTTITFT